MFTPPLSRRAFLKTLGASSLGLLSGGRVRGAITRGRVVVIGGGFGGATAAKYVRLFDPWIEVTLVEPKRSYMTCPAGN